MLETIYNDFTTKLLPQIQQGLVITKDYFADLFGRYVKYLIVMDSLCIILGLTMFIVALYFGLRKKTADWVKDGGSYSGRDFIYLPIVVIGLVGILMFFFSVGDLVKDIYIPEIRVIEKIQEFKGN